jgi:hypothetical protein
MLYSVYVIASVQANELEKRPVRDPAGDHDKQNRETDHEVSPPLRLRAIGQSSAAVALFLLWRFD